MPQQFEIGQGATALEQNLFTRIGSYGWIDGCGVILGGSTTDIELNVESGTVLHDESIVSVNSQTVTLGDGDPQHPRKDIVWIDSEGTAKVRAGVAEEKQPPGANLKNTYQPEPPSGRGIDGVPLAEVGVPTGATDTGDVSGFDIYDRRVAAVNSGGQLRELAADPADGELVTTQLWYNTTADELRAYFSDQDEVHTINTTLQRSLSGPTEVVVENYEDSILSNWESGSNDYSDYTTPAFEGSAAAYWNEANTYNRDYSLPGDGLSRYPDPGDTIAIAVYEVPSGNHAYLGFGKETDDYGEEYRLRLNGDGTLSLLRADEQTAGAGTELGSVSYTQPSSDWQILEVDIDGGGQGVHQFRAYSTSGGSRDTVLAEELSPTSDTTYRGRGMSAGGYDEYRVDRLAVTPS